MERTIEAMAARIRKWEMRAGESFTDYYMHDKVKNVSWAFWLLGKGFNERANELIPVSGVLIRNCCMICMAILTMVEFGQKKLTCKMSCCGQNS